MFRSLIIAAFMLTIASGLGHAVTMAQPCKGEKGLRSKNSNVSTEVRFKNTTRDVWDIYWLDFKGKRIFYNSLKPGEAYTQQTYVTHPWVAVSLKGGCRGPFQPATSRKTFTIK
jgi:von Hippel-Lindau disease tumor supressor